MKLIVDSKICENNNLTLEEFLVLYLHYKKANAKDLTDSIVSKGFVDRSVFDASEIIFGSKTKQLIEQIIIESDKTVQSNNKRLDELAKSLQELYPQGKKEGTQYYWRDSTSVIAKKLKALVKKYGDCFTDEQAIAATKKYVESFNGNYKFMQLLKYFISKNVVKGGEIEEQSQLLSYIENMNQKDSQTEIDWETELR